MKTTIDKEELTSVIIKFGIIAIVFIVACIINSTEK
jgi:hypothetical protein